MMKHRQFVLDAIMKQRQDLTVEQVERLIDVALRLLGNLVHYRSGGTHVEDDVITTVLVIAREAQAQS